MDYLSLKSIPKRICANSECVLATVGVTPLLVEPVTDLFVLGTTPHPSHFKTVPWPNQTVLTKGFLLVANACFPNASHGLGVMNGLFGLNRFPR